uniref:Very long-chain fatty acid transport protein n=1 Tax=Starmerella bombicola TaxID=75736 RepID=A0A127KQ98_STABO|nr:long chain fatty acid transport protein [Starmerella bombicola]
MSGLEIAAAAALGATYVDARLDFLNDLVRMKLLFGASLRWYLAQKRDKVSVFNVFEECVRKTPNKTFLVYPEPTVEVSEDPSSVLEDLFIVRKYTYAEAHERIQKISAYLRDVQGIKTKDTVAIDFVNKPEMIFVWFALWNLSAKPAMINYNLQGKSLSHCVRVSQSKLLIVDEEATDNGLSVSEELEKQDGIPTIVAGKVFFEEIYRNFKPVSYVPDHQKPFDASCYIFTSGTTGLPKAATMSWKKAYWGADLYSSISFYSPHDTLYSAMPLYHSTAAVLGVLGSIHKNGTYAIGHKFSTTSFWVQARLTKATAIQYVGETCRYLLNAPETADDKLHQVKIAHGNGMRPDVWQKFKDRFNIGAISEFYAATESPTAINNVQRGAYGVGACGHYGTVATRVLHRTRWNIAAIDVDTQDLWRDPKTGLCRETHSDEPGEFLFKLDPKNIKLDFQGYVGNQSATDEKLVFDVFKKGDAWVRSGDLLRADKDHSVYFVDRLGDTFRWKSENVSTNEVEEAVVDFGGVDLCVCVGVQVPKHEGRAGFAVIKLNNPRKQLDMDKLGKHLLERLPRYAVPIFIKFVDTVTITGNNKVQKKEFRNQQIPAPAGQTIYWLEGTSYKPLTADAWARVENGRHKL